MPRFFTAGCRLHLCESAETLVGHDAVREHLQRQLDMYAAIRTDLNKSLHITPLPCNWLQCMDNSLDPIHFEHLHGVYGNYVMKKLGLPPMINVSHCLRPGSAATRSWLSRVSTKSISASTALALIIVCTKSTSQLPTDRSP